jgi:hypothetical protein
MNALDANAVLGDDDQALTWSERNQRWLVQQIARLRERIQKRAERGSSDMATNASDAPSSAPAEQSDDERLSFVPALTRVATMFGLSQFERDVLLLTAGVELDSGLRRDVNASTGGMQRPNFALALDVLPGPHWDAMSPSGPLRYWRLITLDLSAPLTDAALRIDERILHYLSGVAATDNRLLGLACHAQCSGSTDQIHAGVTRRIAEIVQGDSARPPLIIFDANDASNERHGESVAVAALADLGMRALAARVPDLPTDPRELAELARILDREAALADAAVILHLDVLSEHTGEHEARAASLIASLHTAVLLLGKPSRELVAALHTRSIHRLLVPPVPRDSAVRVNDGSSTSAMLDRALQRATQQFRVSSSQIDTALEGMASYVDVADETRIDNALWQALRETSRGGLDALAQRIESRTTFDDLVLPAPQLAMLRDITRQLRHRDRVYREWGFGEASSRGLGLCALFTGDSGTGKTMAAEAIANEAQLDLYRIDLATVVSKYIGETEKNLKRLFDAAEASGALLLFDEADALFGKRSEVKDSHDRYANIDIAYLLQRIEAYRGLAILTTNMKSALDRSFMRRIRFVVQFPYPDVKAREEIWRRQFPERAPVNGVDFAALGKLQLAGGNIRSVAINAAFKAADRGCAIDQSLLMDAAGSEYAKLDRSATGLGRGG